VRGEEVWVWERLGRRVDGGEEVVGVVGEGMGCCPKVAGSWE